MARYPLHEFCQLECYYNVAKNLSLETKFLPNKWVSTRSSDYLQERIGITAHINTVKRNYPKGHITCHAKIFLHYFTTFQDMTRVMSYDLVER